MDGDSIDTIQEAREPNKKEPEGGPQGLKLEECTSIDDLLGKMNLLVQNKIVPSDEGIMGVSPNTTLNTKKASRALI